MNSLLGVKFALKIRWSYNKARYFLIYFLMCVTYFIDNRRKVETDPTEEPECEWGSFI